MIPRRISKPTGLRVQRNKWTCGACALRHAMLLYNVHKDDRVITRMANGTPSWGIDAEGLRKVSQKFGFQMNNRRYMTTTNLRKTIIKKLKRGIPIIAPVEQWSHWITIADYKKRKFVIFDSSRPGPVVKHCSWSRLKRLIVYTSARGARYDLYPFTPIKEKYGKCTNEEIRTLRNPYRKSFEAPNGFPKSLRNL